MAIVIKKRVSFDFLGDEYKDAYLTFQSIPLKDFQELTGKIKEAENDNAKAAEFMLESLKHYFVEGSFPGTEKVTAEDLDGLDPGSVIKCFEMFTGQDESLKVDSQTPSPTEEAGQSN